MADSTDTPPAQPEPTPPATPPVAAPSVAKTDARVQAAESASEVAPPPAPTPDPAQASAEVGPAVEPDAAPPAVDGAKPKRRGLIGWLNFYAEDLLAPISKPRHQCARCKRNMWRGYFLSVSTNVKGVSDMQIVCWRCKLAAAQREIDQLRNTGRR